MTNEEIKKVIKNNYLFLSEEDIKNFTDKELIQYQKSKLDDFIIFSNAALKIISQYLSQDEKDMAKAMGMTLEKYSYHKVHVDIIENLSVKDK